MNHNYDYDLNSIVSDSDDDFDAGSARLPSAEPGPEPEPPASGGSAIANAVSSETPLAERTLKAVSAPDDLHIWLHKNPDGLESLIAAAKMRQLEQNDLSR